MGKNLCVPPYHDMYKAEDWQSSHIIIITSAIISVSFKTYNHTTSFYDINILSSK